MGFASQLRRFARFAGVVACVAALALGVPVAADDAAPAYFSYPFGGNISRIAAGPDGTIYVAGWSDTADLPASTSSPAPLPVTIYRGRAGFFFVAALEADGRPRWTSYLRAQSSDWSDPLPIELSVAPDGSAWIAGRCVIEAVRPFQTAEADTWAPWIARFGGDGALLFASPIGGSDDRVSGLAVIANGDAVVTGRVSSNTFPGVPAETGSGHVYVARVRADGSGLSWLHRFGGNGSLRSGELAVDARDDTIVTTCVGLATPDDWPVSNLILPAGGAPPKYGYVGATEFVLRLDGDGLLVSGSGLQFLGTNVWGEEDVPVAIDRYGSILVSGHLSLARLAASLDTVEAASPLSTTWERVTTDLSPDPRGGVVTIDRDDSYPSYPVPPRLLAFGPSLGEEARPEWTDARPTDACFAPDGSLLLVGTWSASAFNVPTGVAPRTGSFVTMVPLDGIRPPSRLRARVLGPDAADVTWALDGDVPMRFDIEASPEASGPLAYSVVGTAPAGPASVRVTGLVPGSYLDVRLVAVFASGVRTGISVRAQTPPVAPAAVVATSDGERAVKVRWTDGNGAGTRYQVQRRVGRGEWVALRSGRWDESPTRDSLDDTVPDTREPVVYRIRGAMGRRRTPWALSAAIVPGSTLRVAQTSGSLVSGPGRERLVVEGTIAAAAGSATFDPAVQDLRLLYGDAAAPSEFVLPAGDTGWSRSGSAWTWSAARTLSGWGLGSEIVLDLGRGRFRVVLVAAPWVFTAGSRSVAINLAFGGLSGGEVRTWLGRPGRLVLR